jgi:hypothetical protein
MLHVIWHIVTGFVVGLLARALLPGGGGMLGTLGSLLGGGQRPSSASALMGILGRLIG